MRRVALAAVMLTGVAAALLAGGSREDERGIELPSALAEQRGPEWEKRFTDSLEAMMASERIPPHVATIVLRRSDPESLADDPRAAARAVSDKVREADRALRRGTPAHVASVISARETGSRSPLFDSAVGPPSHAGRKGASDVLRERTQARAKVPVPDGAPTGPPGDPSGAPKTGPPVDIGPPSS